MPKRSKCISIMPNGEARYFTPKQKPPRKGIKRLPNGEFIRYEKEKALQ